MECAKNVNRGERLAGLPRLMKQPSSLEGQSLDAVHESSWMPYESELIRPSCPPI